MNSRYIDMRLDYTEFFTGQRRPGVNEVLISRREPKSAFLQRVEARQYEIQERAARDKLDAELQRQAEINDFLQRTAKIQVPIPDNVRSIKRE